MPHASSFHSPQGKRSANGHGSALARLAAPLAFIALILAGWSAPASASAPPLALAVKEMPAKPHRARVVVSIETSAKYTYTPEGTGLDRELEITVDEAVELASGEYGGWGFGAGTYASGSHRGQLFFVRHDGEDRGVLTGALQGRFRRQAADGLLALSLQEAETMPRQERTTFRLVSAKPGEKITAGNVMLLVFKDVVLGAGQDKSDYEQRTTLLHLPAADGRPHDMRHWKGAGLEFGEYRAGTDSGSVWIYLENRPGMGEPVSPRRYGVWEGARRGAFLLSFPDSMKPGGGATLQPLPLPAPSSPPGSAPETP